MMTLPLIAIVCMAITIVLKWAVSTAITNKRIKLSEAVDETSQAKFRLKTAVNEVTRANSEIDKTKRKIKSAQRKIERLQKEYQDFSAKAKLDAEMNSEKLRLAKELKQRKGQA